MKTQKVKIDNWESHIISDLKPLQIFGAEKMFNECYKNFFGDDLKEDFFYCGGLINSESFSNNEWENRIKINDDVLSFLLVTVNNDLLAICHSGDDCESDYVAYTVSCSEFHLQGSFKLNV